MKPIIMICAACILCGMTVIYTTLLIDNNKHIQLEYGDIGLGMFFIVIGGWGIRKEYEYEAILNNNSK